MILVGFNKLNAQHDMRIATVYRTFNAALRASGTEYCLSGAVYWLNTSSKLQILSFTVDDKWFTDPVVESSDF